MKKILLKSAVITILAIFVMSCNSDDDGGTQTITPFTTSISGQTFLPTSVPLAQMSNSGRFIIINAINTVTDQTITLSIGDANGTGAELTEDTYPLVDGGTSISYFVNNSTYISQDSGQIVITSLDTQARKISGTFLGTVVGTFGTNGTFTFSSGEFNDITYSVQ